MIIKSLPVYDSGMLGRMLKGKREAKLNVCSDLRYVLTKGFAVTSCAEIKDWSLENSFRLSRTFMKNSN